MESYFPKEALELFHPTAYKTVVSWGDVKVDEIIYLNGLTFVREFTLWRPNHWFVQPLERGGKSKVKWKIIKSASCANFNYRLAI